MRERVSIIGFDSAWTDSPKAPGAVCMVRVDERGACSLLEPEPASFAQPTIVPNLTGCRPVDRLAGSLISWMGGGVQPANRSKKGMFDDEAPIWKFKRSLAAIEDPERTRAATDGLHLLDVFPALALAGMTAAFCGRHLAPRYNPARKKTFKHADWIRVIDATGAFAAKASVGGVDGVFAWLKQQRTLDRPRKIDQDKLDSVICALVGLHWLQQPRDRSMMIGDLTAGYMIAPVVNGLHERIVKKAKEVAVPIDGTIYPP